MAAWGKHFQVMFDMWSYMGLDRNNFLTSSSLSFLYMFNTIEKHVLDQKRVGVYKQFRSFYRESTGEVQRIFNALHKKKKNKKTTIFQQKSNVNACLHKTEVNKSKKKKIKWPFKTDKTANPNPLKLSQKMTWGGSTSSPLLPHRYECSAYSCQLPLVNLQVAGGSASLTWPGALTCNECTQGRKRSISHTSTLKTVLSPTSKAFYFHIPLSWNHQVHSPQEKEFGGRSKSFML